MEALVSKLRARGVAETTIKSYQGVLHSLKPDWKSMNEFRSPAQFKTILEKLSPSTRWVRIATVNILLRDAGVPRSAWSRLQRKAKGSLPPANAKSPSQAANWVTQAEARAVFARAVIDARWPDALLLYLYTQMPPRRVKDYSHMKVGPPGDGAWNWYDTSTQRFVFNAYKTAKTHGSQSFPVPPGFTRLWGLAGRQEGWLLVSPEKKNWIHDQLTRLFGRPVGASLLRASSVTEHAGAGEAKALADAMGHTVGTQQGVYLKT